MRDIDKARWLQLSPLLDDLLDMEPAARAARLAELRAEDTALAEDLAALLARDEALAEDAFLAAPALPTLTAALLLAGQNVGAYTLEREIGQGGMGSVWLARRTDGRFEGQVAIKFLSTGLLGHGDPGRFAREGQILGRLAHPHIARLIDAGIAPEGKQPYLVLEYIDGQPIDRFCEERALSVEARVRLFLDVLAAVAHAHNRLILHRDLKPSNILVDRGGQVKLLDFGIAKLLVGDATQPAAATELTQRVGNAYTLQYASPEQVQGGDVTTATDVYALGVLLFLLLGGRHPILNGNETQIERLRAVVESEPRRLSDTAPAARARELRGDLDTIVARALKKAPAERYANAAAMADDLRRWLAHEPITARPDSAAYRIALFVRRHRLGVAAGTAVTLALTTGLGVALWESREAQHQRDQAEGMVEFMLGDLRKKLEPVGRLDVMDAVGEKALAYYAEQETGQQGPDSLGRRSRALHLLGEIAEKRGKLDEADRMFREAAGSTAALLRRAPRDGQRIYDHAQSVYWVGFIARRRGQVNEAQAQFVLYLELAEQLAKLAPDNHEWRAERGHAGVNLGVLQLDMGQSGPALATLEKALGVWRGLVAEQPELNIELANTLGWISKAYRGLGQYAKALDSDQNKVAALTRVPGHERNRRVQVQEANTYYQIGRMQLFLGRYEEARGAVQRAVTQLEQLVRSDADNMDWLSQLVTMRLGLAEVELALHDDKSLATALPGLASAVARLAATPTPKLDWLCNLRGRLLALQTAHAGGSLAARAESLQGYLDDMQALAKQGTVFNAEQDRTIASIELRAGDAAAAAGQPARAAEFREAAVRRLQPQVRQEDASAQTLQALALARLGRIQEARELAEKVAASAYRHPDYTELLDILSSKAEKATTNRGSPP